MVLSTTKNVIMGVINSKDVDSFVAYNALLGLREIMD